MQDLSKRIQLRKLEPSQRANNFDEVVLGYNEQEALLEANRCLNCINHPCVDGCPIHNHIPEFISKIKEKDYDEAYRIITSNSPLPSICSRVCAQASQCEGKCTRGIKGDAVAIGALERFVCDHANKIEVEKAKQNNHKVVVVGSGPSGIACAKDLAIKGYDVTILEKQDIIGGVLHYGIPKYRLPLDVLQKEIDRVLQLGIKIKTNSDFASTTIDELLKEYECVYIAIGTGLPKYLNIPGEDLKGVYNAFDFMYNINLNKDQFINEIKGKKVSIIGGGDVTMDLARSALRMGAEKVTVIYRRTFDEMPSGKVELDYASQEGVEFVLLTNPTQILENEDKKGYVGAIRCIKMELGEPDESGRRRPIPIQGSEYNIKTDIIAEGVSTLPQAELLNGLQLDKYGCIIVDENGRSSLEKVYAGGDIVTGPMSVVKAIKAGKLAAKSIDEYIQNKN